MKSAEKLEEKKRWRTRRIFEFACLIGAIGVTIAASSVPLILFTLPQYYTNSMITDVTETRSMNGSNAQNLTFVTCSKYFYAVNDTCLPSCHDWFHIGEVERWRVFSGVAGGCGILLTALVLFCSALEHKKILTFPTIFVVYLATTYMVLCCTILTLSIFGNDPYCTSDDLFSTFCHPSRYCTIPGVIHHFTALLINYFILCHIGAIFYKVSFPIHAVAMEKQNKFKYFHGALLIIGFLLPLVPILFTILHPDFNYNIYQLPPVFCTPDDPELEFYSITAVQMVLSMIYSILLIIIIWIIHNHNSIIHKNQSSCTWKIQLSGTEKKLLFLFFLYFLIGLHTNVYNAVRAGEKNRLIEQFVAYFDCESLGSNQTCPTGFIDEQTYPFLSFTGLMFFPLGQLIFVMNFTKTKSKLCRYWITCIMKNRELSQSTSV